MTTTVAERLLDRLLLRHATCFEFGGLVDGIGFFVAVTRSAPESEEGQFVIVRDHLADPEDGPKSVLCDLDGVPGEKLVWVERGPGRYPDKFLPMGYESVHKACEVALQLCEGERRPEEWGWDTTRMFESGSYSFHREKDGKPSLMTLNLRDLHPGQRFYVDYSPRGGKIEGPYEAHDVGVDGAYYVDVAEITRERD